MSDDGNLAIAVDKVRPVAVAGPSAHTLFAASWTTGMPKRDAAFSRSTRPLSRAPGAGTHTSPRHIPSGLASQPVLAENSSTVGFRLVKIMGGLYASARLLTDKNGGMAAHIEIATEVTDELVNAMAGLIPQLSKSNPPPTKAELADLIASDASTMFVARVDGRIVGSLTLAMFRIPTGIRAWIEDVVVDDAARGHGVGEGLNRAALDHAKAHGAITVELTSRPSREAANRLYQRLGFVARETNVYRYTL